MYVSSAQVKPGELMPPMDERRQENNMRRRTLQEVLETSSNMDLLEDEHGEVMDGARTSRRLCSRQE